MLQPLHLLREFRRRLLIHRRGIAALCAAAAVLLSLRALQDPGVPTVPVWTVARDVPAGTRLTSADLRRASFPTAAVPASAVKDPSLLLGRTVAQPLERGQTLSARQVLGSTVLDGHPGRVAIAVRIPDAGVAALLHTGDRVDLWATDPRSNGPAELAVTDAVVLSTGQRSEANSGANATGALVVLAVVPAAVPELAAATSTGFLSVAWNR